MYTEVHKAKWDLIVAMIVLLIADTLVIAARVYVRARMISNFGWDDRLLCLSFLGYVIACMMGFAAMYFGYGYDGPPEDWPHYDPKMAEKFLYANQLTLYITSGIVKLAVALVLYRVAVQKWMKTTLGFSMAVVVIWTFITTMYSSWLCVANGTTSYVSSSTCTSVGLFRTISNIFIDYFYAFFPILIIWNAKMNFRMKLSVCFLLGLGFFASGATIAKLVIVVKIPNADAETQKILHYYLLLWAGVELGLAIFCASAAALKPLLRKFPKIWGSANSRSSHTPYGHMYGRSTDASASHRPQGSTEPLSGGYRELSNTGSRSGRPAGIQEYELSQMDTDRSLEQQKRYKYQRQTLRG
ncbi:hypothetical protein N8I77_012078 [Diaporthe amygdali]|uniref:Rhodopsin domain-containing protein n=1 Tax=Phomopsis amygdali TaxID=1214568 RepID=A0AAD9S5F0_PHOAM|nr:hypothetical protein N8I77_012078 [Diaporthe amygdali]